ncbi:MAG: polysaccharide biosynthesis protein [Spirochaetes bacterium]|jgi:FlaA1/EpsC-like NDP-sugar epimerase|nr:polysaccharide biosynthesis protein [Spirochaetota bacterium]
MKPKSLILIVGAGEAGRVVLSEYEKRGRGDLVAGFVDDDPAKKGSLLNGKRVLGGTGRIRAIIKKHSIGQVIIAMPSVEAGIVSGIIRKIFLKHSEVNVYIVPAAEKFFDAVPISPSLMELPFAELFGREEFTVDVDLIKERFAGRKIMITGAGGSIGSEICRQMLKFDIGGLLAMGRGENSIYNLIRDLNEYTGLMERAPDISYRIADVKDAAIMRRIFDEFRPDIVFHAAAHKHVPLMEFNEAEALRNNVLGTLNMLELCSEFGAGSFVMISTDKAVSPTSVMGATKRIAELVTGRYCRKKGINASVVRFGNVIGSRGSVVPLFREQIERGGPVTVTHPEISRFFMTIPEASLLVINAAAIARGGEIFILDMGRQYRLEEIARRLIEFYGYRPGIDIRIEYTGLRPGEKIEEELHYDNERVVTTGNEKIFVLEAEQDSGDAMDSFILNDLPKTAGMSGTEIRTLIKKLVPEYGWDDSVEYKKTGNKKLVN